MNPDVSIWDAHYETDSTWGFDGPSSFFDAIVPTLPKGARALDLGCGTGRNAIALLRAGCDVFAMDISRAALMRCRSDAGPDAARLHTWQGDVRHMAAGGAFDIILSYTVLNSVAKSRWAELVNWVQRLTAPAGYVVVVILTRYSDRETLDPPQLESLADPGEILNLYKTWDIVRRDIKTVRHSHGTRGHHNHVVERFLFRRPVNPSRAPSVTPQIRNVAVVGPATIAAAAKSLNLDVAIYERAAQHVGAWLAESGRRLVCVPDRGVARHAFDAYSQKNPAETPLILKPDHDNRFSAKNKSDWPDTLKFPYDVVEGITWEQQPSELAKHADAYIAVGLSVGSLIELLWTRWTKQPVFVSRDVCSPLPPELLSELQIFELPDVSALILAFEEYFPVAQRSFHAPPASDDYEQKA